MPFLRDFIEPCVDFWVSSPNGSIDSQARTSLRPSVEISQINKSCPKKNLDAKSC